MKKFLITLSIVAALVPAIAMADSYGIDATAGRAGLKKSVAGGDTVAGVVGGVVNIALSMVGIIFFLIIVYAGFTWMIARGNAEQVDKSKGMIEGAVIGLIIIMAAYAITKFVFESLDKAPGAGGGGSPSANCTPVAQKEGESCGDNAKCYSGQCVVECIAQMKGECGTTNACTAKGATYSKIPGKCPGTTEIDPSKDNVCCYKL